MANPPTGSSQTASSRSIRNPGTSKPNKPLRTISCTSNTASLPISAARTRPGNSGLFLASTGKGDDGYELQILDNYNNKTYTNGQAGSVYKQSVPLSNPCRKPGEWSSYDVVWTAPVFNSDGSVASPAKVTAFLNGVLVQNNFELKGQTRYIGKPYYKAHGPSPIKLQAHGDKSEPISFRNIWIRPLLPLPLQ